MDDFLVFDSAELAAKRSAEAMAREQDRSTRGDPLTVTRFRWSVSENPRSGRASLIVPEEDRHLLTVGEIGKVKDKDKAERGDDKADPFVVPLPPGGGR